MKPKEYILSIYEDAVVIQIDNYFYVDLYGDGYGYTLSESEKGGATWARAMKHIMIEEKRKKEAKKAQYLCPVCHRSDWLVKFAYNNGLAYKCKRCDRFFRIY